MIDYESIIQKIRKVWQEKNRPVLVVIDGGSGSGKTTIAKEVSSKIEVALIPIDDLFSGEIGDIEWKNFSKEEKLDKVFRWKELKEKTLIPLLDGKEGRWRKVDFEAGTDSEGRYKLKEVEEMVSPQKIILLEGAYSNNKNLRDLVDFSILVETDKKTRHERLLRREDKDFLEKWYVLWDEVEDYYYGEVVKKEDYNLVINN